MTQIFRLLNQTHLIKLAAALICFAALSCPVYASDNDVHITGEPLADDVKLVARRATQWLTDNQQHLLLENDISISVGEYAFNANNAVVQITETKSETQTIHTILIYLEQATSLPDHGQVKVQSPYLLVTVQTTGHIDLITDLLQTPDDPPAGKLLDDSDARFIEYQNSLVKPVTVKSVKSVKSKDGPRGTVSFRFDRISYQPTEGDEESTVTLTGNIWVIFESVDGDMDVSMTAQNAVIMLKGNTLDSFASGSPNVQDNILGVYLEQDVEVSSGEYTIRAPRVYYDLQTHKAVVLDAVFFTWSTEFKLPIYLRAKKLRQHSLSSWSAREARMTTSEFAKPHFAIAAKTITIDQVKSKTGPDKTLYKADNATLQWYDIPFMWFPNLSGNAFNVPLRSVSPGYDENDGVQIETEWDMFALLSRQQPTGVEMTGAVDYLGERGPGLGLDLSYSRPEMFGRGIGYILLNDHGEDEIDDRDPVEYDGKMRSVLSVKHKQFLKKNWALGLELGYVSDPNFLEYFFRKMAESDKPFETSIYLQKRQDEWAFDFLLKDQMIDFLPQTTVSQAPQYTVDKLPEAGYFQIGTDVLDNLLTYQTENRVGRMKIVGGSDSPASRGFTDDQSLDVFGFSPATITFRERQEFFGITSKTVSRLDTRHEISAPMKADIIDVTPFVAGRATLYDHDFVEFSGESNNYQLWGSAGVRLHTQVSKTYSHIRNQMLDIHRLRHIVEPMVDVWWSTSTVDPLSFPVYDVDVEGIDSGSAFRFGLRNTLQTQRGGAGRWRTVDLLTVDLNLVLREDFNDQENVGDSPLTVPKYISYRPEFSAGGDHFQAGFDWMVSDTLATVGDFIYDFEVDQVAQWRVGAAVDHSRRLQSFVDYDSLASLDSRLLGFGFRYQLTKKYDVGFRQTLDFGQNETRNLDVMLARQLPRWQLVVKVSYDGIDDKMSYRAYLVPQGVSPSRLDSMVTTPGGR